MLDFCRPSFSVLNKYILFTVFSLHFIPLLQANPANPLYTIFREIIPQTRLDKIVEVDLSSRGITPANLCSDEVFVRRIYLDMTGTLPLPKEVNLFMKDTSRDKRSVLIDSLFSHEAFNDYWTMKWCDVLRVKAEFPINLWPNGVQAYHRWIKDAVTNNMPYDKFATEMLTSSGSNFRTPAVNFFRAIQGDSTTNIANAVALTFMGSRAENWPEDKREDLEKFFSRTSFKGTAEWKETIVTCDFSSMDKINTNYPDGSAVTISPLTDPRFVFSDWLVSEENEWFAKCMANRIWFWLMGRGIIHEADDIRNDNPPSNPELLAYLEKELIKSDYDLQHVYKLILNSRTYQQSSIPADESADVEKYFAVYPVRQLEAEVLIDAICKITGTTEQYSSPIPEPFTFIPESERTIALADGSITSTFLEMFGRPSRDSGFIAERNANPTSAQRLHMLNSTHILNKLSGKPAKGKGKYKAKNTSKGINAKFSAWNKKKSGKWNKKSKNRSKNWNALQSVRGLYLAILSRQPTSDELKKVKELSTVTKKKWEVLPTLAWALMNSKEFIYRH